MIRFHLRQLLSAAALSLLPIAAGAVPTLTTATDSSGGVWQMERLDLDVTVDPSAGTLRVEGTVTMRLDGGATSGMMLAMLKPSRFEEIGEIPGAEVTTYDSVLSPSAPDRIAQIARIVFETPREAGSTVTFDFDVFSDAGAFQVAVSEKAALASWAARWYPGDSVNVAAPGVTRIHVPEGWRALSNGKLTRSVVENGMRVETWESGAPVARSFVAGPYVVKRVQVGDREVGAYVYESNAEIADAIAEGLAGTLEVLEERFGPYPYDAYAVAEIPNRFVDWFGSSEQGFFMTQSAAFEAPGGVNLPLFAHELAHGWWGNLVRSRGESGGILLSESLAQYGAVVAIEALEGDDAVREFLQFSRDGYSPWQSAKGYFRIWRDGNDTPLSALQSRTPQGHNLADAKGHWVYHMLRQRVGDDVFFGTLRDIIDRYGGGRLSLDDMRQAFIDAVPEDAEMAAFLTQWLDRPGAPILDAELLGYEDGIATVRVTQQTEPFALELPLGLATTSGATVHTVRLTEASQEFELELAEAPTGVSIDPHRWLLTWQPEYGERPLGERVSAPGGEAHPPRH